MASSTRSPSSAVDRRRRRSTKSRWRRRTRSRQSRRLRFQVICTLRRQPPIRKRSLPPASIVARRSRPTRRTRAAPRRNRTGGTSGVTAPIDGLKRRRFGAAFFAFRRPPRPDQRSPPAPDPARATDINNGSVVGGANFGGPGSAWTEKAFA
jgi:hypothetical protein